MDVKILEHTKGKLRFEVYGTDHGMMNLLTKKLSENKEVEFTTYSVPHPLLDGMVVTVLGKDPEKEVKKALSELKADTKEWSAAFKKAK
jgi:DNA-directed RNA polymerase subunit L